MVEDLIRVLLTQATSILSQHIRDELNLVVNVEDDINKLLITLSSIKAIVRDAETKEIEHQSIREWAKTLKLTSYDIDDALTDWDIAIRQVNGNTSRFNLRKKFCLAGVFPCFSTNQIVPLRNVAKKIRRINEILLSIDSAKDAFGFDPNDEEIFVNVIEPQSDNENETTCFVDQSTVLGRDKEKDYILSKLTTKGNPAIVFIWGMGGIGKTSVAQLIFDCDQIQQDFDMKIWVSVGKTFDGKRIAKAIVEQAAKDYSRDCGEFQTAFGRVRDSVDKKKFLLVLDNVWAGNHNGLELLFVAVKGGAPGSKILITSRNEEVGKNIEAILDKTELFSVPSAIYMHNLGGLSDEHIWAIYSRFAFSGRNHEFFEDLKVIGREISDKCKGLPLAAKTVGSLMLLKDTKQEWEHVLDDKIWQLELNESLSRPLLLSYYDLPPALKRCFCYCANFPKDTKINAVNLIQIWMAQGCLDSDKDSEMEITARGYLNSLVRRSLFQETERNKDDGTLKSFKMHDMVHDVASYLMENECLMVNNIENPDPKHYRHLIITLEDNTTFPNPPKSPEKLYTFSVQSFNDCPPIVVTQDCVTLLPKFFNHFKYLKTLDMSRNMLLTVPDGIEKLKNLRYLNLSHNPMYKLPETLCNLTNLQTLKLVGCRHLTELPRDIGKLEKLRHLEIDETRSLVALPKGVGKLTSLRTLNRFLISNGDELCSLGDLKHLNHLRGRLKIEGLNHADVSEAKEAELENIVDLHIDCSLESGVIEALQLNSKLVALQIDKYGGQRFPNWMVYLTNLKKLRLQEWANCIGLPPLGKLPLLKVLHIEGFKAVIHVGSEFLGVEASSVFPKLEKLKFSGMENWEEWKVMKGIEIMPCLRYLKLSHCRNLKSLPREVVGLPIKKVRIRDCVILKHKYQKGTGEVSHISHVRIH